MCSWDRKEGIKRALENRGLAGRVLDLNRKSRLVGMDCWRAREREEGEATYETVGRKGLLLAKCCGRTRWPYSNALLQSTGWDCELHSAKRASSERSCFFLLEGFAGGVGASRGGDGRLGTISAALARSSKNLSNSATQKGKRSKNEGCTSSLRDRGGQGLKFQGLCSQEWVRTPFGTSQPWQQGELKHTLQWEQGNLIPKG